MKRDILLITDLDGTLLNSQHEISKKNEEAIKRFKAQGGLLTFATGRMEESTNLYLEQLGIIHPIITYNGGRLYCPVQQKVLQEEQLVIDKDIWNLIIKSDLNRGIIVYRNSTPYVFEKNDIIKEFEKKEKITCKMAEVEDFVGIAINKVLIIMKALSKTDEVGELVELNTKLLEVGNFDTVFSEINYLEVLPTGTTKGQGVEKLKENLALKDVYVIAVGDNLNDIPLLGNADLGIAVKNARSGLKEVADVILDQTNEDDAIAFIINEIIPELINSNVLESIQEQ